LRHERGATSGQGGRTNPIPLVQPLPEQPFFLFFFLLLDWAAALSAPDSPGLWHYRSGRDSQIISVRSPLRTPVDDIESDTHAEQAAFLGHRAGAPDGAA
jgi:hypothetical protein